MHTCFVVPDLVALEFYATQVNALLTMAGDAIMASQGLESAALLVDTSHLLLSASNSKIHKGHTGTQSCCHTCPDICHILNLTNRTFLMLYLVNELNQQ